MSLVGPRRQYRSQERLLMVKPSTRLYCGGYPALNLTLSTVVRLQWHGALLNETQHEVMLLVIDFVRSTFLDFLMLMLLLMLLFFVFVFFGVLQSDSLLAHRVLLSFFFIQSVFFFLISTHFFTDHYLSGMHLITTDGLSESFVVAPPDVFQILFSFRTR